MKMEVLAFDLNGTLMDMSILDPLFSRLFGSASHREQWFRQLQVLWMTAIACGTFVPFEKLAVAALQMLGAMDSVPITSADCETIVAQMAQLPAYPEVPDALAQLHASRFRLVALTNGARETAVKQLGSAGIVQLFEEVFSTDQVQRYKPAPEPYRYVADRLRVNPKNVLFVAAHAWDIMGAANAGMQTAFLSRPRKVLNPQTEPPGFVAVDLHELAKKLIGLIG